MNLKPGDLVEPDWVDGSIDGGRQLGLVVNVDGAVIKVQWSADYGTFAHSITSLEVLNERG